MNEVLRLFLLDAQPSGLTPWGSGHIHDTYAVACGPAAPRAFILQRINRRIFGDVAGLMANISRVTSHLEGKAAAGAGLALVPARDGRPFATDSAGDAWRVFRFIRGARSRDFVERPEEAFEAAKAFGRFGSLLGDLDPGALKVLLPGFHDTRKRLDRLEEAVCCDRLNRAAGAKAEIEFARRRRSAAGLLMDLAERGELRERVIHGDTKINNVLFDEATDRALCVIDLDTVMPGLALFDFGDMVRAGAGPVNEDESDLSKVGLRAPLFEAMAKGYVAAMGDALNARERELMPFSAALLALELGARFLADHLEGDAYFKARRPGHNLDRCRAQFKLAESIERQERELQRVVRKA